MQTPQNHPNPMMQNFIVWNVREANNSEFRKHYKSMIGMHQPTILSLLKSRITDHYKLMEELGLLSHLV